MTIRILGLALSLAAGLPAMATARQDPTPPPSGIVVHLFGQDSVMSNVLPTAPAGAQIAAPEGAQITAPAGAQGTTGQAGTASGGVAAEPAYVEPTTGEILHQMVVTGDPDDPTQPSTGRTKQRLSD